MTTVNGAQSSTGSAVDMNIVARVEALLRTANDAGATVHEAEQALLAAQRVALKHNIDISTLSFGSKKEEVSIAHMGAGFLQWHYRKQILNVVCKNFRCEAVFCNSRPDAQGQTVVEKVIILGFTTDLLLVQKLFDFVMTVGENELQRYFIAQAPNIGNSVRTRNVVRTQWGQGFFLGLDKKFRKQVDEIPGMALMVITPTEVKDALKELGATKSPLRGAMFSEHTEAGFQTGLNIGDPVSGYIKE